MSKHDWAHKGLSDVLTDIESEIADSKKRVVTGCTGKGGAILFLKYIKEKFGDGWTDADQRKAEANLRHGAYRIDENGVKFIGHYAEEGQADGEYFHKRMQGDTPIYEVYKVKNGWVSANHIDEITAKQYEELITMKENDL